jgi:hypothetical protein
MHFGPRRSGLPKPATQVVLGRRKDKLIRVDFYFPGTTIVEAFDASRRVFL